jgi:hypothetical protein
VDNKERTMRELTVKILSELLTGFLVLIGGMIVFQPEWVVALIG